MIGTKKCEYDSAISGVLPFIPELSSVGAAVKASAREIRIRAGKSAVIVCAGYSVTLQGTISQSSVQDCVGAFCKSSLHSYEKELAEGYITLRGGHRAGFCGTAVYNSDKLSLIRDISSINIRIARQHIGCAERLAEAFLADKPAKGMLIIGKPLSGKTTVLRDLCRIISSRYKLSLIDERGEIAAVYDGVPQLDVGDNTDVFSGFYKNDGLIRAIRCMSPEYVVMDELGADFSLIEECLNSGTGVIMTAHCDSISQAYSNLIILRLLESGAISHIAELELDKYGVKIQLTKSDTPRLSMRMSV